MSTAFHLPSVDKLLQHPRTAALRERFGTTQCTEAIRAALAHARAQWLADKDKAPQPDTDALLNTAEQQLLQLFAPRLKAVYNLTGTVLHTNLGRALVGIRDLMGVAWLIQRSHVTATSELSAGSKS